MSWQNILQGGWQEAGEQNFPIVAARLQAANPNFDWSNTIQQAIADHGAWAGSKWTKWSPPEAIADDIIAKAQATGEPWAASQRLNPNTRQQIDEQYRAQHAAENQDDDGFLGMGDFGNLLGLGGLVLGGFGLAGMGPFAGLGGAGAAGASAEIAGLTGSGLSFGGALGTGATAGLGGLSFADLPWGVNPGGGMDYISNIGDLWGSSGAGGVDNIFGNWGVPNSISVPGVDLSSIFPMTGINDAIAFAPTGFPALDFGTVANTVSNSSSLWDTVKKLASSGTQGLSTASKLLQSLGINPSGVLGGLLNDGISLAARTAPGLMALDYANKQPGIDTGNLEGILGQIGGNHNAVIKAATDPLQANIAAGYGDLLQSQGLRGIRGSSFGTTDIANYLSRTGEALSGAAANAAQGSFALQGNLAAQIASLKNQAQQNKNNLFGKAFDVLGRGVSPGGFGSQLTLATP